MVVVLLGYRSYPVGVHTYPKGTLQVTTRPAYKHFKLLTLLLYDDIAVVRHPNNWVTLDVRRACELANMAAADLKLNLHRLNTIGLVSAVQWHSTYVVLQVKEPLREVAH